MGDRSFASIYFRKELGSVGSVDCSQLAVSLLRFINFVFVEVKKAELKQGLSIAGPDADSFFVGSLGGVPFFLLTKAISQIEKVIRFDRSRIFW